MKKVLVFGIFDGIHKGHRDFFREAKTYGDYLIAVVAQDHIVEHLLGVPPKINFADRFAHLETVDEVDKVAIGEPIASVADLVTRYRADAVVFAADQELLREDLEQQRKNIPFAFTVHTIESALDTRRPL